MAEVKVVVSDTKTGKSYQKAFPQESFVGMKLNDKLNGTNLGLEGYELEITGGSDDAGFPMRLDVQGSLRKKAFLTKGTGVKKVLKGHKGIRVRRSVRGNTFSDKTAQVNMKVVKHGSKAVEECWDIKPKEA